MAAHRYWRATLVAAYDGGAQVELSEFWLLLAGTRVDSPATLSCDQSPISGAVANLKDGDQGTFAALPVGAKLTWDFGGSPVDVDDIRLGASDSQAKFLGTAVLESSDDGVAWTLELPMLYYHPLWYAWPGPRELTVSVAAKGWSAAVGQLENGSLTPSDPELLLTSTNCYARGVASQGSGVRQFEITTDFWRTAAGNLMAGVIREYSAHGGVYRSLNAWAATPYAGTKTALGANNEAYFTPTFPAVSSDVLGVVVDFTLGTITFYRNGVSLGEAFNTLLGEVVRPYVNVSGANITVRLETTDMQYPIAGATPWTKPYIAPAPRWEDSPISHIVGAASETYVGQATLVSVPTNRSSVYFSINARGRILGTVKRKDTPANVPLARRVRLYRDRDGLFIRETWSDALGNYRFDYVEEWEAYTAVSFDHTRNYRAVAADNLTLENGGITLIP